MNGIFKLDGDFTCEEGLFLRCTVCGAHMSLRASWRDFDRHNLTLKHRSAQPSAPAPEHEVKP